MRITVKTTLAILGGMTSLGLSQGVTRRKTAWIWAGPGMDGRLVDRPPRCAGGQARAESEADDQAMDHTVADLETERERAELILGGRGSGR